MSAPLPEEIRCPACGEALVLTEQERREGKYTCPVCKRSFDINKKEMICPQCKAEYVKGIFECAECQIPLVEYLPAESEEKFLDYVEILSTYNAADVAVIKSLLDGEKIEYHFRGEIFNRIEPLVQPVRLFVREDQSEIVRESLKEVLIQLTGVSLTHKKENDQE